MKEVERKCKKREKGEVMSQMRLGFLFNEVGVGLMRVISEMMSCQVRLVGCQRYFYGYGGEEFC